MTAAGEVPTAVYFDTAYVAKCYVNESDSPGVRALLARGGGAISSALCMPEMAAVLTRHEREGALDHRQVRRLFADFEKDVARGVWTLAPVTDDLLRRVARRIQTLPATVFLRAADAIHLCTAAEAGLDEVWTSDRHMLAAAPVFGLRACSV